LSKKIGILAIQGAYHKHQEIIKSLGYEAILVKNNVQLQSIDYLIMPGGESTAMVLMLKKHHLWLELKEYCRHKPVFGTCAGAILLGQKNIKDNLDTLGIMDINISRNSYGRQIDSFETDIKIYLNNKDNLFHSVFIRAPIITQIESKIEVLASYNETPVLVKQNNKIACTFHPELTSNTLIHEYFINL